MDLRPSLAQLAAEKPGVVLTSRDHKPCVFPRLEGIALYLLGPKVLPQGPLLQLGGRASSFNVATVTLETARVVMVARTGS